MADPNLYSLLFDDEPTAQEHAAALVAALRGQQQQVQQRDALASIASMGQNPLLQGFAKGQLARVGQQETDLRDQQGQLYQAGERRLQRQVQADHYANELKQQQADLQLKRDEINKSRYRPDGMGRLFDSWTGQYMAGGAAPQPGGGGTLPAASAPPLIGPKLDKELSALGADLDPYSGRGAGVFGKDAALHVAADKIKRLIQSGPNGAPNFNLTVRQVPELVQSVGSMLSNGSSAAQAQLEHLLPATAGMSVAQKMEYLTGHPEAANVPEFVKQYYETAQREDAGALSRIKETQLRRITKHQGLFSSNKAAAMNVARQYLPDLNEDQLAQAFTGQAGGGGKAPDHDAAAAWLADPKNKSNPYYAAAKAAYDKAHSK